MTKKTEPQPEPEPVVVVHDYDPVRPKARRAKPSDTEATERVQATHPTEDELEDEAGE